MKILKDGFRADMERIKRELTALQGVSIHVGILGDAGSDILMIAGVHEYGATISAKNVKHLAIPLNMEAKNAGSPANSMTCGLFPFLPAMAFWYATESIPRKPPVERSRKNMMQKSIRAAAKKTRARMRTTSGCICWWTV